MSHIDDGGPAFPHEDSGSTAFRVGLSKRELYAAILMHGELVTCGVPGAAADALVDAAVSNGQNVEDRMAQNAVECADALLRALSEPRPEPAPAFPSFNVYAASDAQRDALRTLHTRTWFEQLPDAVRTYVTAAVESIARNESDIPF